MKKGKICVVGLTGQSAFFSVKNLPHPGETVSCSSLFFEPGGKGHNQAVACARMGAEVLFISAVGTDDNGNICRMALQSEQIETDLILKSVPTAFAVITVSEDSENIVEVFGGAAKAICPEDLMQEKRKTAITDCEYLLLQNELSMEALETLLQIAETADMKVVLNPAPAKNMRIELMKRCDVITPNYGEAKQIAGFSEDEEPSEQELCDFFSRNHLKQVIITCGAEGVLLIQGDHWKRIPAFCYGKVTDTTGAGDTFNGALTAALAAGFSLERAAETAVTASGISVTRKGAVQGIPRWEDVEEQNKLLQREQ